jgi:hypothetical protein
VIEVWKNIPEFPYYDISNLGNIWNRRRDKMMSVSLNNHGHVKITLMAPDRVRHTRSVAQLVADAFVDPPSLLCDHLIVLDGDFTNIRADNLSWRPQWFAWKYTRQLKEPQPNHYRNLPIENVVTGEVYDSVIDAGIKEGLLFNDIWRSTYSGDAIYPFGHIFIVL